MSLRFTQDEVKKAVDVMADFENVTGQDIVKDHVAALPVSFHEVIEFNTEEYGALATFSAGILAGLIIANQRNLTK